MSTQKARLKSINAVVLYGTIGMFLRYVSLPSELVAMCRGIIGSLFILLFLQVASRRTDGAGSADVSGSSKPATRFGLHVDAIRANLKWLIISGISLGLNWIFLFAAYTTTTVAIASLCNYMAPLIVIVIAPILLHEKLEYKKLPCVSVAFIGIVLVSGVLEGERGNIPGILLGLAAALCFVSIVICNRKLRDISPYDRSVVQLILSAVTILPYFLIHNRNVQLQFDTRSVLIILMLGLIHTGVAYCFYFSGLGSLSVQTIAVLGYLEPVVSVLCSALLLREHMSVLGWIGAVLIILAAVISEILTKE
jgi:RarD protein